MSQQPRALSERWKRDLETIAHLHGMTFEDTLRKEKFRVHVLARRDCYAYLREQGWSYPEIGALFGRDHSTVMWALCDDAEKQAIKLERNRRGYMRQLERRRRAA